MPIIEYISLILLMFFIAFFADVFYRFIRYKTIIPQKMFTFKKGGLFEHYIIVGTLSVILILLHAIFDISPFGDNIVAVIINTLTFVLVAFVFLVFIFVFLFYLVSFIYAKIAKIEDRVAFYHKYSQPMIMTAIILSGFLAIILLIIGVVERFR